MNVAAVVVSFNRKALLVECLDALLGQTQKLDRIIIIENNSTDGTVQLLKEGGYLDNPLIECVVLGTNIGGAGGFSEGLRRAVEQGYDWVWLMDDDAEPDADAYRRCLPYLNADDCALVAPLLGDAAGAADYGGMHRGVLLPPSEATIASMGRPISAEDTEGRATLDIDLCSFVGPFISAKAVAEVGLPRHEFFIHYDDIEYTLRLRKSGRLILIPRAIIKHKQAQVVGRSEVRATIFGPKERIRYDKLWSSYYGYRNLAWLIARKVVPTRMSQLLGWHARLVASVLLYDDHKISRIRFWNSSLFDGLAGRFDNEKPRQWLANSLPNT